MKFWNSCIFLFSLIFFSCSSDEKAVEISEVNIGIVEGENAALDIDKDGTIDITFDVIPLSAPNPTGNFATRAQAVDIEILDNSTFGYADALTLGNIIDDRHHYHSDGNFVLSNSFNNAMFPNLAYLGFRKQDGNGFRYGWLEINTTSTDNFLAINKVGLSTDRDIAILAGKGE